MDPWWATRNPGVDSEIRRTKPVEGTVVYLPLFIYQVIQSDLFSLYLEAT